MSILSRPSEAFSTSLIYITVGTLVVVWTIVSLVYYPPESDWGKFLVVGFLASGVAVLVIGLLLGPIGRAARNAELPPAEVTTAVEKAEQTAAANPPVVSSVNGTSPAVVAPPASNGPVAPQQVEPHDMAAQSRSHA